MVLPRSSIDHGQAHHKTFNQGKLEKESFRINHIGHSMTSPKSEQTTAHNTI